MQHKQYVKKRNIRSRDQTLSRSFYTHHAVTSGESPGILKSSDPSVDVTTYDYNHIVQHSVEGIPGASLEILESCSAVVQAHEAYLGPPQRASMCALALHTTSPSDSNLTRKRDRCSTYAGPSDWCAHYTDQDHLTSTVPSAARAPILLQQAYRRSGMTHTTGQVTHHVTKPYCLNESA